MMKAVCSVLCLMSSIVATDYSFFEGGSHLLEGEYISANHVIAFYLYPMNKIQGNLIKIRHVLFFGGLTGVRGFRSTKTQFLIG